MNVPKSPITLLVESIQTSERMRDVVVLFGARSEPEAGSPARIVLTPTTETHEPPEHQGNWLDALLTIEAHCWGDTFDVVRYLRDMLIQCCFDFQLANDLLRLMFIGGEHEPAKDTAQNGWGLRVTFSVRDCVERVPLFVESGMGIVEHEQLTPDSTTAGPTLDLPPS